MTIDNANILILKWFESNDSIEESQFSNLLGTPKVQDADKAAIICGLNDYCSLNLIKKVDINTDPKKPTHDIWVLIKSLVDIIQSVQIRGDTASKFAELINNELDKLGIDPIEKVNKYNITEQDIKKLLILLSNYKVLIETKENGKDKLN